LRLESLVNKIGKPNVKFDIDEIPHAKVSEEEDRQSRVHTEVDQVWKSDDKMNSSQGRFDVPEDLKPANLLKAEDFVK
jgi:hypothetical protein